MSKHIQSFDTAAHRLDERMKCAQIAAKECSCGMPFEQCHVAQEILLAREEAEAKVSETIL